MSGRAVRQALVAVLVAAVVVVCLRLGWWQLERFTSGTGSWQNLGYTLQWPTFAAFAIVVWWRLRTLHTAGRDDDAARDPADAATGADTATADGTDAAAPEPRSSWAAPVPTPRADERDDELAAYNSYLARLNARPDAAGPTDQEHSRGR